VRRVYAHLGTVRHRSEVVEFRIEQHPEALKDPLGGSGLLPGYRGEGREENENPRSHRSASGG
jgi:hypothetical protein